MFNLKASKKEGEKSNEHTIQNVLLIHFGGNLSGVFWIMWSSIKVHLVDALAAEGDEGRCSLR